MRSIATERSYVDLPIVGSGGSSVGGELVGWLHGVWPYNHSHNDVFFSLSLYLSLSLSLSLLVLFLSSASPLVSSSLVQHVSSRSRQPTMLITIANSLFLVCTILTPGNPLSTRSRCARGGRDTPVRVRHRLEATKQAHRRPITMASPPKRFIVIGVLSAHASMRTNHCFSSNGRLVAPAVVG